MKKNSCQAPSAVVTTLENHLHQLEDGDVVSFREVKGMTQLNGKQGVVKGISNFMF